MCGGAGRGAARPAAGKIGRVAGGQIVQAGVRRGKGAQIGAQRRDVADVLGGQAFGQQGAGRGLQLHRRAGAAVAGVVPFQRHDAAAAAQVRRPLAGPGPGAPRQPQRRGADPGRRAAAHTGAIIQSFG